MYDLDAMRQAVKKTEANVEVFEEAIKREIATKKEYENIIRKLEAQGA